MSVDFSAGTTVLVIRVPAGNTPFEQHANVQLFSENQYTPGPPDSPIDTILDALLAIACGHRKFHGKSTRQ